VQSGSMNQAEKISRLRRAPQRLDDQPSVRVVVREDGAARFESEVLPDGRDETVVLAQLRGEPPADAVRRALARIASIERSGRTIESAVLLVAPWSDAELIASRSLVTRALVAHMAASRRGELVISAEDADESAYGDLNDLADALRAESLRSGVDVRLRLGVTRSSPVASTHAPLSPESSAA
jgi:hypothetical protein